MGETNPAGKGEFPGIRRGFGERSRSCGRGEHPRVRDPRLSPAGWESGNLPLDPCKCPRPGWTGLGAAWDSGNCRCGWNGMGFETLPPQTLLGFCDFPLGTSRPPRASSAARGPHPRHIPGGPGGFWGMRGNGSVPSCPAGGGGDTSRCPQSPPLPQSRNSHRAPSAKIPKNLRPWEPGCAGRRSREFKGSPAGVGISSLNPCRPRGGSPLINPGVD